MKKLKCSSESILVKDMFRTILSSSLSLDKEDIEIVMTLKECYADLNGDPTQRALSGVNKRLDEISFIHLKKVWQPDSEQKKLFADWAREIDGAIYLQIGSQCKEKDREIIISIINSKNIELSKLANNLIEADLSYFPNLDPDVDVLMCDQIRRHLSLRDKGVLMLLPKLIFSSVRMYCDLDNEYPNGNLDDIINNHNFDDEYVEWVELLEKHCNLTKIEAVAIVCGAIM